MPAFEDSRPISAPPPVDDPFPRVAMMVGLGILAAVAGAALWRRRGSGAGAGHQVDAREYATLGSAFEDQQHVPVADERTTYGYQRTAQESSSAAARPFDFGVDPSAPGDVPGGP
jgi:hypothetical protein